mmetsp:Transcript_49319/g.112975  ORF Transcript_49319/g.112975 Transcript_49319/m.112975 type:complete len:95 (+) Transcript_49319:907-1191(+)
MRRREGDRALEAMVGSLLAFLCAIAFDEQLADVLIVSPSTESGPLSRLLQATCWRAPRSRVLASRLDSSDELEAWLDRAHSRSSTCNPLGSTAG